MPNRSALAIGACATVVIAHAGAGEDFRNTVEQHAGCEHMTERA